jgi:hypothetical protein
MGLRHIFVFSMLTHDSNPLRTNQFYMSEMTAYAASLTGAKGKSLEPETITVGPKKLVKLVEEKSPKPEKVSSKSKNEEEVGSQDAPMGHAESCEYFQC